MLSQKRAVVTGGSDGIGLGIAKAFAQNGAHLFLVARDEGKLRAAAAALAPWRVDVHVVSADLADPGEVTRTAQVILDRWPELDILVNNAGTARFLPFVETDEAVLDLHLNLNVKAPYLLTHHLFGALVARQGTVINYYLKIARKWC